MWWEQPGPRCPSQLGEEPPAAPAPLASPRHPPASSLWRAAGSCSPSPDLPCLFPASRGINQQRAAGEPGLHQGPAAIKSTRKQPEISSRLTQTLRRRALQRSANWLFRASRKMIEKVFHLRLFQSLSFRTGVIQSDLSIRAHKPHPLARGLQEAL